MKILCIGDVFAKPGRAILRELLPSLIEEYGADFVIVNGENAAGGRGISQKIGDELLELPADVITSGNHIWQHDNVATHLKSGKILRPHNAPSDRPGSGVRIVQATNGAQVGVINLQGKVHMYESEKHANPFHMIDPVIDEIKQTTPIIIVDLHAEITAEKRAFGYFVDGKVSCLYGTHTHIQTADEQILPNGTAYITDIGMTGPQRSVIGIRPEDAIKRFRTDGRQKRWKPAEHDVQIQGIVIEIQEDTGKAVNISRIRHPNVS